MNRFLLSCIITVVLVNHTKSQTATWVVLPDSSNSTFWIMNAVPRNLSCDATNQLYSTIATGCFGEGVIKYSNNSWRTTSVSGCDGTNFSPLQKDSSGKVYTLFTHTTVGGIEGRVYSFLGDSIKYYDTSAYLGLPYNGISKFTVSKQGKVYVVNDTKGFLGSANPILKICEWNTNNWIHLKGLGNDTINVANTIALITTEKNGNPIVLAVNGSIKKMLRWTGTSWLEMGTNAGYFNLNNTIDKISKDYAGNFFSAGKISGSGLEFRAYWNESTLQWEQVGNTSLYYDTCILFDNIKYDHLGNAYSINKCGNYVAKWNGSNWQQVGNLSIIGSIDDIAIDTYGNIYATGISNSTNKTYLAKYEIVMPVKINYFKTTRNKNNVELKWQTATEINTSYFNILRSNNGRDFITIGKVDAKGANDYTFENVINNWEFNSSKLYYQLEIVDKGGSKTYSTIKSVDVGFKNTDLSLFPNPSKDFVFVSCVGMKEIIVVDSKGKVVLTQTNNTVTDLVKLNLLQLVRGFYIVKVITANGEIKADKLLID